MADSLLPGNDLVPTITKEEVIEKWKDKPQEELLAAKAESDIYINTLTARFDDLRKDYLELREQQQTGAQLKEFLDRMEKQSTEPESPITHQSDVQPGIKPEDLEGIIAKEIAKNQLASKQNENLSVVQAKLKETLGDNYEASYKQRLDSLGLTKEFADDLAKNYPAAFMKTFGLDQTSTSPMPTPRSSHRPTSFAPNVPKRDWAYYQEMKKTNPRLYLDPKIAIQMNADAEALGEAFGMPAV